jgi:hypothetical protein
VAPSTEVQLAWAQRHGRAIRWVPNP